MTRELTTKEKMFLKEYFKTGNGTRSALKAYNCKDSYSASTIASQTLSKLKDVVKSLMESKGLDLGMIIDVTKDATKATKIVTSHTEPDYEVPDHPTRLKAAEIAGKWLGISEHPTSLTQVNIDGMKVEFIKPE